MAGLGRAQHPEWGIFCFLLLSAASQSSVQHICSSRSPTQLFLLGVNLVFLPFYPNFTLQTSSFNSPTESQAENLHPLLVPRHRGTNLPSWECAQWKETGRDYNVLIKAVKFLPGWYVGEFPSLKCSAQVPTLLFPWGFMD